MIIYLIRHGESMDDIEEAYGGIADYALSPTGRDAAKVLAEELAASGITKLYSSPYRRALETAELIAERLRCSVHEIPDLRERNSYGVLSGVTKETAKQIFGHVLREVQGKPGDYYSSELVTGAEPLNVLFTRVRVAFDSILQNGNGIESIGVVTHGNVTRAIYEQILNIDRKVDLDHLAVTTLDWNGEKLLLLHTRGVSYGALIART